MRHGFTEVELYGFAGGRWVAAQSNRVMFLTDGMIRDEITLDESEPVDDREKAVMAAMARLGI